MRQPGTRKTRMTTLRLSDAGHDLWERLARRHGLTKTGYLEMLVRREAREQGMDVDGERPAATAAG